MELEAAQVLAAAFCMGIGSIAAALGEGYIGGKTMEAIGRNPSSASKIIPNMIVAMAITESTAIYSLLVTFLILFTF